MSITARKTITLEIDAEHEDLLRRYADFLGEMRDLAASAPDGSVLDACEEAVIERGGEQQRQLLERTVQSRLDVAEKKGRRCGSVLADSPGRIEGSLAGRSSPAWGRSS